MNRKLALATLLISVLTMNAISRPPNPVVGTWKLVLSPKALKGMPKGAKPPAMSVNFKPDGTMSGLFTFGKQSTAMKGTWKLKGDKLTMKTTHVDGKPEKKQKDEVVTLSKDKKSFELPNSNGMGKMVKQ